MILGLFYACFCCLFLDWRWPREEVIDNDNLILTKDEFFDVQRDHKKRKLNHSWDNQLGDLTSPIQILHIEEVGAREWGFCGSIDVVVIACETRKIWSLPKYTHVQWLLAAGNVHRLPEIEILKTLWVVSSQTYFVRKSIILLSKYLSVSSVRMSTRSKKIGHRNWYIQDSVWNVFRKTRK